MIRSRLAALPCALLLALPAAAQEEARPKSSEAWRWLAKRYDADGDGRIARAEYPRGDDTFACLDRDKDGVITRADLDCLVAWPPDFGIPVIVVRLFGGKETHVLPIPRIVAGVMGLDRDGDGRVSEKEFRDRHGDGGPAGVDGFATLQAGIDADGDRLLAKSEIEAWLVQRDRDGDGLIGAREPARAGPPLGTGWIEPEKRIEAPDFKAFRFEDSKPVALRELRRGRPIALVFGSFSCGPFSRSAAQVAEIHQQTKEVADLYLVYIREAHAIDTPWPMRTIDGSVIEDPRTLEERLANTRHCRSALPLSGIPALVDTPEDAADQTYQAWPDRLVLIDADGRLAYRSEPGPYGFEPQELRDAIRREAARTAAVPKAGEKR